MPRAKGSGMASPILVTGVPRSGTTWLARLLASAPGTALSGREPMNPRGRQYGLAHTLSTWAQLGSVSHRQRWALTAAYRGVNPWVYSRYGRRQWAAPLPWTRLIVKDPFALLSIPVIESVTRAQTVVVYRHPGAVLVSYRRMGWSPDVPEILPILRDAHARGILPDPPELPPPPEEGGGTTVPAMAWTWNALHALMLSDASRVSDLTIVSHEELALHGQAAERVLFDRLGLRWNTRTEHESVPSSGSTSDTRGTELHRFDRVPAQVAEAWRAELTEEEIDEMDELTAPTRQALHTTRLPLDGDAPAHDDSHSHRV